MGGGCCMAQVTLEGLREWDVWCVCRGGGWGYQAQKKPPVFLPHVGAGGLSFGKASERCPSHYNLLAPGHPTWAKG